MWILILSLVGYRIESGIAVTSVGGFQTYAACARAGEVYARQHSKDNSHGNSTITTGRWSCVKDR